MASSDRIARLAMLIGSAGTISAVFAQSGPLGEPFPATIDLGDLLPAAGGDGSLGFGVLGAATGDRFGASVSAAGDINGDGIDDFIVGDPRDDPFGRSRAGSVAVVFGREGAGGFPAELTADDLDGTNGFRIAGWDPVDYAGVSVAGIGDFDGDGVDDLLFGVPGSGLLADSGGAIVLFGRDASVGETFPAWLDLDAGVFGAVLLQPLLGEGLRVGEVVAAAGDVNGDGLSDVILGATGDADDGRGKAYVVFGYASRASLFLESVDGSNGFRIDGSETDGRLGIAVSSAGDLNGDGFDDVIIGADGERSRRYCPGYGGCYTVTGGRAYVLFGGATGTFPATLDATSLTGANGFAIEGGTRDGRLGTSVASLADLNGDGFDDAAIGAPWSDPTRRYDPYAFYNAGQVFVVYGRDAGFPATLDVDTLEASEGFVLNGDTDDRFLGEAIAGGPDVNGDGLPDVSLRGQSRAFVLFGRRDDFPAEVPVASLNGTAGFQVENEVMPGSAGDLNGDGVADLAFGIPFEASVGRAYVLYGRQPQAPCPADVDGDGELTFFDFLAFQNLFDTSDPRADFDGDGALTLFDFLAFQNEFSMGCP